MCIHTSFIDRLLIALSIHSLLTVLHLTWDTLIGLDAEISDLAELRPSELDKKGGQVFILWPEFHFKVVKTDPQQEKVTQQDLKQPLSRHSAVIFKKVFNRAQVLVKMTTI